MQISSLHIYPVKSGQGISLKTADMRPRGLAYDRRLMIVDSDGQFLTQRQFPKLATLKTAFAEDQLMVAWPGQDALCVQATTSQRVDVRVWRSNLSAVAMKDALNTALSNWLEKPVTLVKMDGRSEREADPNWVDAPSPVSFADGYPILITNRASLDALNAHILEQGGHPVPMSRFRPNIVVNGDAPWAEDGWKQITIGDVVLDLVKPCIRCIMTTLDQSTGEKQGKEPLRALKALRSSKDARLNGVLFGWNAVPRKCGTIAVGDRVEISPR